MVTTWLRNGDERRRGHWHRRGDRSGEHRRELRGCWIRRRLAIDHSIVHAKRVIARCCVAAELIRKGERKRRIGRLDRDVETAVLEAKPMVADVPAAEGADGSKRLVRR